MKKNFISAIAGWKSAALLALVAMVAAVAFSGVLSTTKTADAVLGVTPNNTTVAPGASVTLTTGTISVASGGWTTWTLTTTGAAEATFEASDGATLVCQDVARVGTCDADASDATLSVKVKIASDSGTGAVVVRVGLLETPNTTDAVVLTVAPTLVPTKITLTPSKKAHSASKTTEAELPVMNVKVTNSVGKGVAVPVSLTTTLGLFTTASGGCATGGGTLACTTAATQATPDAPTTDGLLAAVPALSPVANRPGVATVTATVVGYPSVTATATVTFFGLPKNIEASPQQGSIQIGGSTFVVVTVTDAAGSPVSGIFFGGADRPVTTKGPSVIAKAIGADFNRDYDANGDRKADKGDIQACGNDEDDTTTPADSTNLTSDGTNDGDDLPAGTNQDGQCVIMVSADGPPAPAARGAHTVNAVLATVPPNSATATVNVGGPPATIMSDAPESVEPLSETSVNLTVLDDEGIAVGETALDIDLISPQGLITANPTTTKDGKATFSFIAALDGEVVFRVAAGTPGVDQITDSITIIVGAPPAEEPEAPPATWNNDLVSGQNLVVWNGADGADPSEGAADGVSAIWSYNTGSGSWDGYFPDAADVPGGNTLTSLSNGQAYVVIVD